MPTIYGLDPEPIKENFEDYVAAYFQAAGYYCEMNIMGKENNNVFLELDILLSNPIEYNSPILIEVKSGQAEKKDIFKIAGWMQYLGIKKGGFIVKDYGQKDSSFEKISSRLNIHFSHFSDQCNTTLDVKTGLLQKIDKKHDIEFWRYSNLLNRQILRYLVANKNSQKDKQCFEFMVNYLDLIKFSTLQEPNVIKKISLLLQNYKSQPKLAASTANEIRGNGFEPSRFPDQEYELLFYNPPKINPVHVACYLEHILKISIIKHCIQLIQAENSKNINRVGDFIISGNERINLNEYLPKGFYNRLKKLSKNTDIYCYPIILNWFFYIFGGFILEDIRDREILVLASKSKTSVEKVEEALRLYDAFFPKTSSLGWMYNKRGTTINMLDFYPLPLAGIGIQFRCYEYFGSYDMNNLLRELNPANHELLCRWVDLSCSIMAPQLLLFNSDPTSSNPTPIV